MALQRLRTVALVFVLLCSSQTFQLPIETAEEEALVQPHDATEQARVIWNSVKKLQRRVSPPRRREKRQAELEGTVTISETELETLAGVAPQYILDIYRNLSTTNMHTQANTIRSLKTLQTSKDHVCGWFNFTLDSIHRREFVISVQLVLQIRHSALQDLKENYFVVINRARHGHEPEFVNSQYVSSRQRGPIEFDVLHATTTWLKNQADHPHRKFALQVEIYDSLEAYSNGLPPMPCDTSPLQFHYTTPEPLLVVDSFDPEKEEINYSLFSGSYSTPTSARERRSGSSNSRRQTPVIRNPTCRVHNLQVRNSDLNNLPLIQGQTVKVPQQYNAGICGGECVATLPRVPQHALLIHVLIGRNSFTDHGYSFRQCCAPVAYNALDVISTKSNQVVQITRFKNMQIQKCECIDVVVFNDH